MTSEPSCHCISERRSAPGAEARVAERQAAYRIKLSADFDLTAAASLADYLSALGVSHIRCSPTPRVAPECGTAGDVAELIHDNSSGSLGSPGTQRFSAALRRHGLEQLSETPLDDHADGARGRDVTVSSESDQGAASIGLLGAAAGLLIWQQSEDARSRDSLKSGSGWPTPGRRVLPTSLWSGVGADQFHDLCIRVQSEAPEAPIDWPQGGTNRGEDALARLLVLSEIPGLWRAAIAHWSVRLEQYCRNGVPDRAIEYLFYETAVGSWPLDEASLRAFLVKAARELGIHTSYADPSEDYERELGEFVGEALRDRAFVAELSEFAAAITLAGRLNSLALLLIKLTAPGVPQIQQGTELWDLSLANTESSRHRVDYAWRRRLLQDIPSCNARTCLMRMNEGMPKLWVLHRTLLLRKFRPEPFSPKSSYTPIQASGAFSQYLVSYVRGHDVMVVVPRWTVRRGLDWGDTMIEVPEGEWSNCLTDESLSGGVHSLAQLASKFPLVLLERVEK